MGACDRLVDDPTTETADPRTPPRIAAETLTRELPGFPPDRKWVGKRRGSDKNLLDNSVILYRVRTKTGWRVLTTLDASIGTDHPPPPDQRSFDPFILSKKQFGFIY